jgi:hypothetical protein
MPRAHLLNGGILLSTFPSGVGHVFLISFLLAGEEHFVGIDDDDEIPGIKVRSEDRLVLAAQDIRHLGGQPAKDRAIGINHMPLLQNQKQKRGENTKEAGRVNRFPLESVDFSWAFLGVQGE